MIKKIGIIKDATKQLGKAMTQVTDFFERDDDSIGAQSHAQVGRIVSDGSELTSLEEYVCLDSCSSEHVFCDSCLVFKNLESNGGSLTIQDIANFEGFEEESVWFSEEAITNILFRPSQLHWARFHHSPCSARILGNDIQAAQEWALCPRYK